MFKATHALYPWLFLVSELILYRRCKIYFNYQDEQLRGSAYYPSGPNPAQRPLCPCQYFQLSMVLTFPVAGVLISSATREAPERSLPLSPGYLHMHSPFHQDLKIPRCHCKCIIIQLIFSPKGPISLRNKNFHS